MSRTILIVFIWLFLSGCSQGILAPDALPQTDISVYHWQPDNVWSWGHYTIRVSEDRTSTEILPMRSASWHLNVTPFVEGPPCPNCLTISKPQPQGDGTIKLTVWLRHPFPGQPEYTGFDVRGIVVFKATDYMQTYNYTISTPPGGGLHVLWMFPFLNFSDPTKGGAALLNQDGYTFYLNPLLEYVSKIGLQPKPILNYSKGKYAVGDSPDCTVNAYKLFSDGSPRRMFKTTDFISRTFHIKPPSNSGPFEFGYVVHACWAKPTHTPVTNPETDFPVEANCEDPWQTTIEQLQPVSYGVTGQPLFKATVKHRPLEKVVTALILVPSLSNFDYYDPANHPIYWGQYSAPDDYSNIIDDETTEVFMYINSINMAIIGDGLVPGHHLGILSVHLRGESEWGIGPYESQLNIPIGVMPVDVYVEL